MAHSSNTIFSYRSFILWVQVWIRFVASLIFILRIVVQYSPWLKQVSGHRRKLSQQATVRGPQSRTSKRAKPQLCGTVTSTEAVETFPVISSHWTTIV